MDFSGYYLHKKFSEKINDFTNGFLSSVLASFNNSMIV